MTAVATMRPRILLLVVSVALVLGFGAACSDDSDDAGSSATSGPAVTSSTTSTAPPTTTTTVAPTTSAPAPTTTVPIGPTSTAEPGQTPGEPCAEGSSPDCIDPFGDGDFVYLLGGADCMDSPIGGPACADLDGDGYAGYPDRG